MAIAYPSGGEAQVAECVYGKRRLIVRRTRLTTPAQARLWPDWRHVGFLTDLDGDAVSVDAFHRRHAVVELAIGRPQGGRRARTRPLGELLGQRCLAVLCGAGPQPHSLDHHHRPAWPRHRADRRPHSSDQLVAMPARLVNRAGTPTLRGPAGWPWASHFAEILTRLRALQPAPGESHPRGVAPPQTV